MTEPIDWCAYFSAIEMNPEAITPRLTVREFMAAREHVYGCDSCYNKTQRVLAKMSPKQQFPERGEN